MSKNIGYHTRLYSDNTVKVVGGSFGGSIDQETVERLTRLFDVIVKPSGTPVFVDSQGREVRLYLSVDAIETIKGKEALKEHTKKLEALQKEEDEKEEQIETLLASMSNEEILARLTKN